MSRGDLLNRWSAPPTGPETRPRYLLRKALRHAYWARTEGFGRLVEEDRLDPRQRIQTAVRKARWRRSSGRPPGDAQPVYVVGLQRSGTNMLMRGLDEAPEIEVHNENDKRLFERFRLRSDAVVVEAVAASRHEVVVVKPICDSHRVDELVGLAGIRAGKALWVVRDYESRARSEVSKFGPANLLALRDIAAGRGETRWQGQRLTPQRVELVQSFDLDSMTPDTAAVLFWVIRNGLYFDLGLADRADIMLVSYEAFSAEPAAEMRRVCRFIGLGFREEFCAHVTVRQSHGSAPLQIDERVRELAEDMTERLRSARAAQLNESGT